MSGNSNEMGQAEGALSRAAGLVRQAKGDFDTLAGQLEGRIQGMSAQWRGAGGSTFRGLAAAWLEKQRVITRALDDFEGSLRGAERTNIATDEAQSAAMARFRQRL